MKKGGPSMFEKALNLLADFISSSSPGPTRLTEKDYYTVVPNYLKDLYDENYDPSKDKTNVWANHYIQAPADTKIEMPLLHEHAAANDFARAMEFVAYMKGANLLHTNAAGQTAEDVALAAGNTDMAAFLHDVSKPNDPQNGIWPIFRMLSNLGNSIFTDRCFASMDEQAREHALLDAARIGHTGYLVALVSRFPDTDLTIEDEEEKSVLQIAKDAGNEAFAATLNSMLYPAKPAAPAATAPVVSATALKPPIP